MNQDQKAELHVLEGLEFLREARALLEGDGLDRRKLRLAARRFWSAEFHSEEWPFELRRMAENLTAQIFRHGPIDDAFRAMNDETAARIRQDLIRLCDNAERAASASAE